LASNGTSPGTLYGIAWTHSNIGGQSISGLGHQALFMENGVTQTAIGNGVWTRANVDAVEVYARGWLRNSTANTGIYNQAHGAHFYASAANVWNMGGGNAYPQLIFRDNHASTIRGYVYADSSGFGLLHSGGGWAVRTSPGSDAIYIPGKVGIGTTDASTYRIYGRTSNATDWGYRFNNDSNSSNVHIAHGGGYGLHINAGTNASASTYALEVYAAGATRMYVRGDGNVGIGNTSPSYRLHVSGDIYADSGWLRTSGNSGWYSESYGGGWHMTDSTWIRSYNNKSIYQNTGTLRTDGTFQVGSSGGTLNVDNGGNFSYRTNVLFANTSGNVGVGTNSPGTKLTVVSSAAGSTGTFTYGEGTGITGNGNNYGIYGYSNNRGVFGTGAVGVGARGSNGGTSGYDFYGEGPTSYFSGNVGVGITTPSNKLEVRRYTSGGGWQNSAAIWGFANDSAGGSDSRTVGVLGTGQGDTSIEYNAGVWGEADYAQKNYGVIGVAGYWNTTGDNYGVMGAYGTYYFPSGDFSGVFGGAPFVIDNNLGVGTFSPSYKIHAVDTSDYSDNAAVYGEHAVRNYYGKGVEGRGKYMGVYGWTDSTDSTSYGGYFSGSPWAAAGTHYGVYAQGKTYDFYAAGPGTNYGPFTGAHEVTLSNDFGEVTPGMLVSATGNTVFREGSISATVMEVEPSNRPQDKAVLGALVAEQESFGGTWHEFGDGVRFASVNSLGEGMLLVTNYGGDIKNGDLITTSPIPGMGMLQDDDLMHSYTAGKSTQNVDWDSVTDTVIFEGKAYKKALITVTYHAG
jgi:hypothetical protein